VDDRVGTRHQSADLPSIRISPMQKWLAPALNYIPRWVDFQMRVSEQPGCVIAIAHKNRIVLEQAPAARFFDAPAAPEARRFMAGELVV
jgi:hypothetical protein